MSIWAGWSKRAVTFLVGFADRDIAGKAETETLAEEGAEGEVEVRIAGRVGRYDALGSAVNIRCHGYVLREICFSGGNWILSLTLST